MKVLKIIQIITMDPLIQFKIVCHIIGHDTKMFNEVLEDHRHIGRSHRHFK